MSDLENYLRQVIYGMQESRDDVVRTLRQAARQLGYELVPVEPTEKMIHELMCVGLRHAEYKPGCSPTVGEMIQGYQFMLRAAPPAQEEQE